jgi:hypothetical protein
MVKSDILDGYFGIYYIIILNDSKEDVKGHKKILIKNLQKIIMSYLVLWKIYHRMNPYRHFNGKVK